MALEGFGVCKTCTATVRRRVPSAGWINYQYRMKIHLLVYGVTQNESWSASSTEVCWMERGGRWADPSNLPAFEGMKLVAQNLENSVNAMVHWCHGAKCLSQAWRNNKSFNMQWPELLLLPHDKHELLILKCLSFERQLKASCN